MKLRSLSTCALGCAFLAGVASPAATAQNIVLILSDDQSWTGTSVQMDARVANSMSDLYRTPSLERLAAEGMTFSNAYSPAPNCSPTPDEHPDRQDGRRAWAPRTSSTSCPTRRVAPASSSSTTRCTSTNP